MSARWVGVVSLGTIILACTSLDGLTMGDPSHVTATSAGEGHDCPAGQYRGSDNQCLDGCTSSSECARIGGTNRFCNVARHTCVECTQTGDCPTGKQCSASGTCAEACSATGACPAGLTCCSALCVDTASDVFNCKGCGTKCSGAGAACCGGTCVNVSRDVANCGKCGQACAAMNATPWCSSGRCGWDCAAGFAHCKSGSTGCETNLSTNCCSNADCNAPPAACYEGNCSGPGGTCSYSTSAGTIACGSTCCKSVHGSC